MLHVILHDKIYWKFSPIDTTCWIHMQTKNQNIFFLLYASNPQFTKVVSFCAVNSKVKRKKNNFPLFYATKYLGFLWWNLSELNLFLRSVGCPNLGQSKYTKKTQTLTSMTDIKPLNYKGCCELSMVFFPKNGAKGT